MWYRHRGLGRGQEHHVVEHRPGAEDLLAELPVLQVVEHLVHARRIVDVGQALFLGPVGVLHAEELLDLGAGRRVDGCSSPGGGSWGVGYSAPVWIQPPKVAVPVPRIRRARRRLQRHGRLVLGHVARLERGRAHEDREAVDGLHLVDMTAGERRAHAGRSAGAWAITTHVALLGHADGAETPTDGPPGSSVYTGLPRIPTMFAVDTSACT